jgi:hypothetical protein
METIENLKAAVHLLVCFNDAETAKAMSEPAAYLAFSGSENSSITFLHLTNEDIEHDQSVNEDEYQSKAFKSFVGKLDKNKFTVRTFIKKTNDYIAEVKRTVKEQNFNLLIYGMSNKNITPALCSRLSKLKGNPTVSESEIKEQFKPDEWLMMNRVSELFDMNPITTCLFINNNLRELSRFFIPILGSTDIKVLPSAVTRFARKEKAEFMFWDAIGAIEHEPKLQKFYNSCQKLTEDKVYLWNSDKKIEVDFILLQDLCIMGVEGWNKLVRTNLPWIENLPSTLIIKSKTI